MRKYTGSFWTPPHVKRARAMWARGISASEIGAALGISQNAVLSRSWREEWPRRVPHPSRGAGKIRARLRRMLADPNSAELAKAASARLRQMERETSTEATGPPCRP
jgi:hypothetical protein